MQPFLFKMASATSALNRKFLTANEVLQGVFADADSDEEKSLKQNNHHMKKSIKVT